MVQAPQHSRLSRLARKAMALQRNFEWLIFLGGLLTPCVMALVVSAAPPQLPASFLPADTVTSRCRVAAQPEVDLFYTATCHGMPASCWSDYYWAVTLPVELQPPGGTVTPVAPALASLTLTLRTAGGAFEEAASLGATFAEGLHIPCRVDPSSGAVSVSENATAPSVQQQQQQLPMPGLKGMVLVHTVWGSFLDGLGAPPRPPPAWLTPLGWLPLLRLCGPGVPLLTLSSLLTAARMAELRSGPLVALLVPAMLAAAAEAASAVVAEARVSARERAVAGRSLLPVAAALAYVACGALLVAACVAEPLLRELRRAWRAADAVAYDLAVEHPLGEPLRRAADGRGPYTRSHAHARSTQAARPEQPRTSQI